MYELLFHESISQFISLIVSLRNLVCMKLVRAF